MAGIGGAVSKFNAKLARRKLDKLWSEIIHLKYRIPGLRVEKCWWCHCTRGQMHAHHIFHKNAFPAGRYLLDNGILLCFRDHFKLHHNRETDFIADVVAERGQAWFTKLQHRCNVSRGTYSPAQYELDFKSLNDELVKLGGKTE